MNKLVHCVGICFLFVGVFDDTLQHMKESRSINTNSRAVPIHSWSSVNINCQQSFPLLTLIITCSDNIVEISKS